ncbi:MAG: helix-turn-helix domain-containing protein [Phycisphaerae bacterium]|nr:helix-turn-helix domain-containing protein [Phycisphaerae bacterium]
MENITNIVNKICAKYGITEKDLKSDSRIALFVSARKELAQKLRKVGLSYASIGFVVNRKDHTTIKNYLQKKKRTKKSEK